MPFWPGNPAIFGTFPSNLPSAVEAAPGVAWATGEAALIAVATGVAGVATTDVLAAVLVVAVLAVVAAGAVVGLAGVAVAEPPQAARKSPLPPSVSAARNRRRENAASRR
jgi:hypothetical protein